MVTVMVQPGWSFCSWRSSQACFCSGDSRRVQKPGAQFLVGRAALEDLVGDLEQGVIAVIAFFFPAGFLSPPNRRTSRLYRACSRVVVEYSATGLDLGSGAA